jgi:hypothetical protein
MKKSRYPLPLISKSIDCLTGTTYFTKLDNREAYLKLWTAFGNEWKAAFCMLYGNYKYTIVSFGLVNAPSAFHRHINTLLCEFLNPFCIAYLDDLVVYSNLLEEHEEHVRLVLAKLQEAGLYLKLSKCEFNMHRISFVRFIVTPNGVGIEPERVKIIEEWPEPSCHCGIQVFLGFANFYHRFISAFSKIAKPVIDMLKEGRNGCFHGPFVPSAAMR